MKKDKKKNNVIKDNVDLSIIKENDLDKTATFTDLLSRKERKQHKREKNYDVINDNEDNSIEFKTEELSSQIAENKTVEITEKERKKIITEAKLEEPVKEDVIEKPVKEHHNILNTIFISLIIMIFIGLFVYAIIYTDSLSKDLYLLIDGISLMILIFNYCLMTISKRKAAIFFTIINYLIIIGIITFNILIYFKII